MGVLEGREDVSVSRSPGEMREYKSTQHGGLLYVSGGSANTDCWSRQVDVGARCTLGQVDATGATVDYSGVKDRK